METLIVIGGLVVVVLAQLLALSRKPRDFDRDYAVTLYKEMHHSYMEGRKHGAAEQQVGALDRQWSVPVYEPPLQDEVPYAPDEEAEDRGVAPMPDGTPSVVEVTESPLKG